MPRSSISPNLSLAKFGATFGGTLGAMLALTASLEGCSAILGDFSVGPATDASTSSGDGGSTDDGTVADGPGSVNPDATVSDGSDAGSRGDGSSDAAPGTGTGSDGGGGDVCSAGSTQCADGGVQDCVDGTWTAPVPCTSSVCSMGQCTGTCTPNTAQCSGNSVQRCDSTGHLGTPGPCVSQACVAGACQGVCVPGGTRCEDGGTESCALDGSWSALAACGTHQACTGGGTTPATCACETTACTGSGTVCADGTDLASCMQDGQGCWFPSTPSACTNGACFGSPGSASCCTNQCTTSATKCGGAGLQTCQAQGNGCTAYNAGTACGTHQACTGTAPSAQCTCTADPTCTSASNVCTGTTLTTCAVDGQGCFYATGSASCGANAQCTMSNTCACDSGFTACGSACVNTMTDLNNCGSCGHVCPTVSAPSSMACVSGTCTGYIGGFVAASSPATAVASNPDSMTIAAVKATMPAVAGTFSGFGAVVGSTAPQGDDTVVIFALYTDTGGMPDEALIDTSNSTITYDDPSALHTVQSGGYISRQMGGFDPSLAASSTYWVYFKSAGQSTDTVGVSTEQTVCRSGWINQGSPIAFTGGSSASTCTGDYEAYMIVTFP
jgi:hypothetical protein